MKRTPSAMQKSQTAQLLLGDNGLFVVSNGLGSVSADCEPRSVRHGKPIALSVACKQRNEPMTLPPFTAAEKPPFSCKCASFVSWC